jgi:hypothetical protein
MLCSSFASAGTIPLRLEVSDGENSQQLVIDAPLIEQTPNAVSFDSSGAISSLSWQLDWNLIGSDLHSGEVGVPSHANFMLRFSLKNFSNSPRSFSIVSQMPVSQSRPMSFYQGIFSPIVADLNGDAAVLTGDLAKSEHFYTSLVDGNLFEGLLDATSRAEVGPYESSGFPTPGGAGFSFPCFPCDRRLAGPAVESDIGFRMDMALSGVDEVRGFASLQMVRVPEPGSLALLSIFLVHALVCLRPNVRRCF